MTDDAEHSRPEPGDGPGGLVGVLSRWENSGGQWRVLSMTEGWISVGLLTCGGDEEMSRVSGRRSTVLRSFLAGRTSSREEVPALFPPDRLVDFPETAGPDIG